MIEQVTTGGYLITIVGLVYYVSRVRDNVREELHISEAHEAKIKEFISDELDAIAAEAIDAARKQLTIVSAISDNCNIADCKATDYLRSLQLSRYMRILDHGLSNKLYKRVCGWVRENGFVDSEGEELERYIRMRARQAYTLAKVYIDERTSDLCPDLSSGRRYDEDRAVASMRRVIDFAKTEKSMATREIKEYRKVNGFNLGRISSWLKL